MKFIIDKLENVETPALKVDCCSRVKRENMVKRTKLQKKNNGWKTKVVLNLFAQLIRWWNLFYFVRKQPTSCFHRPSLLKIMFWSLSNFEIFPDNKFRFLCLKMRLTCVKLKTLPTEPKRIEKKKTSKNTVSTVLLNINIAYIIQEIPKYTKIQFFY